jgi:hypothetical protein
MPQVQRIIASPNVDVTPVAAPRQGGSATWGAIGDLGNQIANSALRIKGQINEDDLAQIEYVKRLDYESALNRGEAGIKQGLNDFQNELLSNPDPDTYLKNYDEAWKDIQKNHIESVTNPVAKRRLTEKANLWGVGARGAVAGMAIKGKQKQMLTEYLKNLPALINTGDIKTLEMQTARMVNLNLLTPVQGQMHIMQAQKTIIASTVAARNEQYFQQAMSQDTPEKQILFANRIPATNIEDADRNALKARIEEEQKVVTARRLQEENKNEEDTRSIYNKTISQPGIAASDLVALKDVINTSTIKEQEKTPLLNALNTKIDDLSKPKEEKIVSNPAVKAQLLRDLYNPSITKKDYFAFVDKALTDKTLSADDHTQAVKDGLMAQEFTPTQIGILADADERAGRALVDYKSEPEWLAAFSAATGEEKKTLADKRKLQFELLNQYNNEVKEWLRGNSEKTGREFEQYRDGKRFEYINRRAELEKNVRVNIETFNTKTGKPTRKPNESIAEYLKRTGQE